MSAIPVNLKTDSMVNPQGIDSLQPVFSWQLRSTEKNVVQTAYQIVVADSDTVVRDSGMVQSNQVLARYQGAPLQARKIYQWTVAIWDNHGSKDQSAQAFFEMGLFKDDWKAKWIEPVQLDAVPDKTDGEKFHESIVRIDEGLKPFPSNYSKLRPPQFIRKDFRVGRGIKRARAYVTARGIYLLEVNGVRAGHAELTPDFTSYPKYLQYQTYDITDLLADGANAIGAVVADGWYISRIGNSGESCGYGNRLALLLQVEIEYEDGSYDTLYSDENFKSSTGPLE
jgi:alpha-L-rhamnosidase